MAAKKKFYVVWKGNKTGLFDNWKECQQAVKGFEGAIYKSFPTREEAEKAVNDSPWQYIGKNKAKPAVSPAQQKAAGRPVANSISVDAACNSVTGQMEYQGVHTTTGQLLFKKGPFPKASNNIGEFLAIVHALAWCKKHKIDLPIYTDSHTAMVWVKNKKAKTKVEENHLNEEVFDLISRAEAWLQTNTWKNPILKWNTEVWGEIPADFGRK